MAEREAEVTKEEAKAEVAKEEAKEEAKADVAKEEAKTDVTKQEAKEEAKAEVAKAVRELNDAMDKGNEEEVAKQIDKLYDPETSPMRLLFPGPVPHAFIPMLEVTMRSCEKVGLEGIGEENSTSGEKQIAKARIARMLVDHVRKAGRTFGIRQEHVDMLVKLAEEMRRGEISREEASQRYASSQMSDIRIPRLAARKVAAHSEKGC